MKSAQISSKVKLTFEQISCFESQDLHKKVFIYFISAQTGHFREMTSSCFSWFSPRGQDSISNVLHSDYPGGISGDKKVYLKIMIIVPVNLIRQQSCLEMKQLNDSIIWDTIKCRQSVYDPVPLSQSVFVCSSNHMTGFFSNWNDGLKT